MPGITTVIKPLTNYGSISESVLEAARVWGINVHRTIELYCSDSLDLESLDLPLKLVIAQFDLWLDECRFDKHDFITELPMGDNSLMYGGIPDLILDGKLIVEIKTRDVNRLTDSIQTAAQEKLWIKNGGSRAWAYERRVLSIGTDRYSYPKVNGKDDWGRFRKLLDHYHDTKLIQSWRNTI